MKLSAFLAALTPLDPKADPEIIILRDWGELAPARILDPAADLTDGDPVIELINESGDAIILIANPEF